jgi:hypothetical protein
MLAAWIIASVALAADPIEDAGAADAGLAVAEVAPAPQVTTAGSPAVTVKVGGYVDLFYSLNFNFPSNLVTAYRGFDNRSSSFTIEDAVLDTTGSFGPVSARIALQVGHAPASYYLAEPNLAAQAGVGASSPFGWQLLQQALIGYQVPVGRGLLAEAGIFLSPIGVEVVSVKDNWNYSRSNLFFALPAYHAGARFTYPLTERWTAVLHIANGWNDIVNKNPYPCFSGLLTYTVPDRFALNLLYFGGVEQATGAPEGQPWRNLFDSYATWQVTSWLELAAQADTGFEHSKLGVSYWYAGAAYVRTHPVGWLYVAARADYFHETAGANEHGTASRLFFPADNVASQTLTLEFRPVDHLSLRVEYRHDGSDSPMYYRGTVPVVGGTPVLTATDQQTLTLGASAWF